MGVTQKRTSSSSSSCSLERFCFFSVCLKIQRLPILIRKRERTPREKRIKVSVFRDLRSRVALFLFWRDGLFFLSPLSPSVLCGTTRVSKKKKQTLNYFQKKKNEVEIYSLTTHFRAACCCSCERGKKRVRFLSLSLSLSLFSLFVVRSFVFARASCVCVCAGRERALFALRAFFPFIFEQK